MEDLSPVFEYLNGSWIKEGFVVTLFVDDSVSGRVRFIEVGIANPNHSREGVYSLYQEVRLRDVTSNIVLFYGRISLIEPAGSILRIVVKDGLSEFAERKVDTLTGGPFTRRSVMISTIISQNSYPGNFDLAGIENSVVTGSFNRTFEAGKEGPTVLSEIARIAEEDPWDFDSPPAGYGYDFYVQYVSATVKQRFYYFKRGSKPSSPVSSNGLTLKKGGEFGDQERPILPGYSFVKEGTSIITCVRVRYLTLKDPSDPDVGKEWAYTQAIDSSLEAEIKRRKMLVVDRSEISTSGEAQALASALLHRLGRADIRRGYIEFPGFPVIKKGESYILVRAGHLVHVTGLDSLPDLDNKDMFITSFKYFWPLHITSMEVLTEPASGPEYSSYDPEEFFGSLGDTLGSLPSTTETLPSGLPVPPFGPPEFMPAIQPLAVDIEFYSNAYNHVGWYAGPINFADGTSQSINAGSLFISQRTYLYLIVGNSTLQNTTTFSDTIGAEKATVALVSPATSGDKALIMTFRGREGIIGGQQLPDNVIVGAMIVADAIVAGHIDVAQLSAIAANMGLLTAGEIRVGTGILGSNFTGWRLWMEGGIGRIAGYNDNVLQWYSDTDGKLYAGGGAVLIDVDGITITGTDKMQFKYGATVAGYVRAWASDHFSIYSPSGFTRIGALKNVELFPGGGYNVDVYGGDLIMRLAASKFYHITDLSGDLGASNKYFKNLYIGSIFGRSGYWWDIPQRTSAPTAVPGRIYYDMPLDRPRIYAYGAWRNWGEA